jgi:hypothetical protein
MPQYIRKNGGIQFIPKEERNTLGLKVSDQQNPSKKRVVYEASGKVGNFRFFQTTGDYGIGVSGDGDILKVIDISNPLDPEIVSEFSDSTIQDITGFDLAGSNVYVIDNQTKKFNIIDFSNVRNPEIVGSFTENTSVNTDITNNNVRSLVVSKTDAYIAAGAAIIELDISDPTSIIRTGKNTASDNYNGLAVDTTASSTSRHIAGSVIDSGCGVVLNREDLSQGVVTVDGNLFGIITKDSLLFENYTFHALRGAEIDGGDFVYKNFLFVVDVTNYTFRESTSTSSGVQTLASKVEAPIELQSIVKFQDFIYASGNGKTITIDVSNPYQCEVVDEESINAQNVTDSDMVGDLLFVTDQDENGLTVLI